MRERTILSLDIGTSSCKAALIARDGKTLRIGKGYYPLHHTDDGGVEQSPEEMLKGAIAAVDALRKAGANLSDVVAISFSSQNSAQILVGEDDRPLTNMISWMDARSAPQARELSERFSRARLRELTGMDMEVVPGLNIPRMKWFCDAKPELMRRAKFFVHIKEYVLHYLTGAWTSDYTSVKGMLHLQTHETPEEILDFCGLDKNVVPPVDAPDAVGGALKKDVAGFEDFTAGIPVVVGWNDMNAAVLGMVGTPKTPVGFDLTGTSEHIGVLCDDASLPDEAQTEGINDVPFWGTLHTRYGVTSSGGQALDWYLRFCIGDKETKDDCYARLMREAQDVDPKETTALFLPYVHGERNPWRDDAVRASFQGIDRETTRAQMTCATLEGVAFALRASYERLSVQPETIVVGGGAANNALWNRIKADVLQTRIVRTASEEAGCVGAAILAWKASGFFSSMDEACDAMISYADAYEPRAAYREWYREKYARFLAFYEATASLYQPEGVTT